jgi:acyl dehydratase
VTAIGLGSLPPLEVGRISRTTLALFAGASGDHNPIHIDLDVARSAGLEDVFAHGMLGMAYLGRLLTDWVPQERIRSFQVRFVSITPINSEPTCSGTVIDISDGLATIELQTVLADGTVTLQGSATVDAAALIPFTDETDGTRS